ncbi:MAG: hypothetical protein AAF517_25160, partial [Planctomycetota bacterium]
AVAAFASSLLVSMKRGLGEIKAPGAVKSCTLTGSNGKISFFDMENAYLVAVTDNNTLLDARADAIQSAVTKIQNRRMS